MAIEYKSTDPQLISVAVAHGDPLIQAGILTIVQGDVRFAVAAGDTRADVVVTDYDTGLAMAASVRARRAGPRVLVITQRDGDADVFDATAGGVMGYILYGCPCAEVLEAIASLHRGQRHLSAVAANRIAEHVLYQSLTTRELDVLHLTAAGLSNKEIARDLGISLGTVKAHMKSIMGKLEARTRTEAAHIGQRRGLLKRGDVLMRPGVQAPGRAPAFAD